MRATAYATPQTFNYCHYPILGKEINFILLSPVSSLSSLCFIITFFEKKKRAEQDRKRETVKVVVGLLDSIFANSLKIVKKRLNKGNMILN